MISKTKQYSTRGTFSLPSPKKRSISVVRESDRGCLLSAGKLEYAVLSEVEEEG